MIDDQVNEEEIAESRKRRQAAADDGMPAEPEAKAAPAVQIQYRTPKHWVKSGKLWLGGAGGRTPT